MASLPTFTNLSDATAQRILNVFKNRSDVNGNPLTPQQAYRQWLKTNLMAEVARVEADTSLDAELT